MAAAAAEPEASEQGNDDGAGANGVAAWRECALEVRGLRGVEVKDFEAPLFVAVVIGEDEAGVGFAAVVQVEPWDEPGGEGAAVELTGFCCEDAICPPRSGLANLRRQAMAAM